MKTAAITQYAFLALVDGLLPSTVLPSNLGTCPCWFRGSTLHLSQLIPLSQLAGLGWGLWLLRTVHPFLIPFLPTPEGS